VKTMTPFDWGAKRLLWVLAVIAMLLAAAGLPAQAQRISPSPAQHIAASEPVSGTMTPAAGIGTPGAVLSGKERNAAGVEQSGKAPAREGAAPGKTGTATPSAEPEESVLFEHEPPTRVRISILNATGAPDGAAKVAVLLGDYRRRHLEDKMGLKIELVNISTGDGRIPAPVAVYYRPGFLRAALLLARAIPGDTVVSAMRPQALKRAGVDVEVVVGQALP
jgi:hypothetical protein